MSDKFCAVSFSVLLSLVGVAALPAAAAPPPQGACCNDPDGCCPPNGNCFMTTSSMCFFGYQGDGTSCDTICPPFGAC